MSMQLFVPKFRIEECISEIRECLEKGWTGLGFKTVEFENKWKEYTGISNAHFLNSATSGLHLAFELFKRKYNWSSDDEVITTPLTFVSTNHAILQAGLMPIFADVDEYLCLDPKSVLQRITPKTKAVVFVGIGGNTGRYEEVLNICRERGLIFVLDAAHMAGTRLNGVHIGHDADATIFSFQAVKNLPTADSGMICFKNNEDDERARKLTWLGINKDTYARTNTAGAYKWMYDVEELGYKYHGNSIMAGIALVSLKYLDNDNSYRRQIAKWYSGNFSNNPKIRIVENAPNCESSNHLFQIRVRNRDSLIMVLNSHEVYPGVHYRDNTEYKMYCHGKNNCPHAKAASDEIISLPMHIALTKNDIDSISELVIRYVK